MINIYCDESCHLQHDESQVMVLGAIWCDKKEVKEVATRLKEIREKHKISIYQEIKWVKVSPSNYAFYKDIIDYFFDNDDLHFRGIIIPDKSKLNHENHHQTHDDWYYKMLFNLLKVIIDPREQYHVFLDYKDIWGRVKIKKLHEVLQNENYDFSRKIITNIQLVRSHEVQLIQLCDVIMGAVAYKNRDLTESEAKSALVERLVTRAGYSLTQTTLYRENKMNLLKWNGTNI